MTNLAYHITGKDCLPDGRPIPAVGETLRHEGGAIKLFEAGLHWSQHPMDAWQHGPRLPDGLLHLVSYGGETITGHDRGVSAERTILASVDLRFACQLFAWKLVHSVIPRMRHYRSLPENFEKYLRTYDASLLGFAQMEVKRIDENVGDCPSGSDAMRAYMEGVEENIYWTSLLSTAMRRDLPINHLIDAGGKLVKDYYAYYQSCPDWFCWAANTALLYAQIGIWRDNNAADTRSVM